MAQVYTSPMPVDVDAAVISNTRLSDDYSVIALAAPEVASLARPGQFVMVKPSRGCRPAAAQAVFHLRDPSRPQRRRHRDHAPQQAHRRRHDTLYEAEPGARIALSRSARASVRAVAPPAKHGWWRGRGPGAVRHACGSDRSIGGRARLFYGARRASELYYVELFERIGVEVVLTTEDGSRGSTGYVTGALDAALRSATPYARHSPLRLRTDADDAGGGGACRDARRRV